MCSARCALHSFRSRGEGRLPIVCESDQSWPGVFPAIKGIALRTTKKDHKLHTVWEHIYIYEQVTKATAYPFPHFDINSICVWHREMCIVNLMSLARRFAKISTFIQTDRQESMVRTFRLLILSRKISIWRLPLKILPVSFNYMINTNLQCRATDITASLELYCSLISCIERLIK